MGWLVCSILFLLAAGSAPAEGVSLKLPLPVEAVAGARDFETRGPVAGVLSGFLIPSAGPLTGWAPVYSTLGADGTLTEAQTGSWVGERPDRWIKVVKAGFVPAGFRVLVRTAPAPVQTRQVQVFWKPWSDGSPQGPGLTSRVYGQAAGPDDQVRIIELTLPEGDVPTALYGQTLGGAAVQVSLVVRRTGKAADRAVSAAAAGPQRPRDPASVPAAGPPTAAEVPPPAGPRVAPVTLGP